MQDWLTKTIYKNALKKDKVFLTKEIITSNGITGFNVYIYYKNNFRRIVGIGNYWSNKKECYHCTVYGSSRSLDIILNIGYSLGLKFHDIRQNYRIL